MKNGSEIGWKVAIFLGGALIAGAGSLVAHLSSTMTRSEVQDLVHDTAELLRTDQARADRLLAGWRTEQIAALSDLRGDVQKLQQEQARTTALLERVLAP